MALQEVVEFFPYRIRDRVSREVEDVDLCCVARQCAKRLISRLLLPRRAKGGNCLANVRIRPEVAAHRQLILWSECCAKSKQLLGYASPKLVYGLVRIANNLGDNARSSKPLDDFDISGIAILGFIHHNLAKASRQRGRESSRYLWVAGVLQKPTEGISMAYWIGPCGRSRRFAYSSKHGRAA